MAEANPSGDKQAGESGNRGGSRRRVLWAGLGVVALMLLWICGALVVTLDFVPGTKQPTPIPSPPPLRSNIEITLPSQGATVDYSQSVEVNGVGSGLFEGNVVVQAYDGQNNLLAEAATIINSPDAATGGSGPWSVTLNMTAPSDPRGLIFAFSNSPTDSSITASSSVEVAYVNSSAGEPALVIINPDNGSVVDITEPITVAGGGVGLFENLVVVRALDETGKVLAEQPTTTGASEPGGVGRWSVSLSVRVTAGTKGFILAFSPPHDSSTMDTTDEVAVAYGAPLTATPGPIATVTPTPILSTLTISEPPNGSVMPIGQVFTVSGTGSNLFENNVVVRAYDQSGTILAEQPTILDADTLGGSGTWSVALTVQVELGTPGHITAFSPSVTGNMPDTYDGVGVIYNVPVAMPPEPTLLPTAVQPIVPSPELTSEATAEATATSSG